ncbi:MAG: sigma-54-dependent Fis family transcriptional regulator [Nitrospinae bacterium]|nr:sigma-54-dependent Fis family transcriptional regulator [Nitrospinota bacterium]
MKSVLVVDDEPEMRIALQETLERAGYAVMTAVNGEEGLRRFEESPSEIVITDVRMPKVTGIEVLRSIKKKSPRTPVVMITAYGTIDNAVEAMKEGAFDYILKPFSAEAIETAVWRASARHSSPPEKPREEGPPQKQAGQGRAIITEDKEMIRILDLARNVAYSKASVFIQGESGTGKENLARFIHENSQRNGRPFVAINCAALPEGLLESELFGHEKGSFTGAIQKKIGKFELAHGGTILLDEITEMDLLLQAKLLRVLQEYEIDRVGGREPVPVDVRVIATTNRDAREIIKEKKFREDLYYRLNVIPLEIPPLRKRKCDILPLSEFFLKKYYAKEGPLPRISQEAAARLMEHGWPGNVRELENIMERACLLNREGAIEVEHLILDSAEPAMETGSATLQPRVQQSAEAGTSVREMEKKLIFDTLEKVGWSRTKAAEMLGISIRTLRNKLQEYRESGELAIQNHEE